MISTNIHKYDDVLLQKVYSRIWSGRQRPSFYVLPPTSEKKRTTQSQWTADNASNQYLQKSDQFSLSLHPSFLSQGNTLPWEKAIYSEAGAHKFTATAIIFHQIIMINPNFLKKAPSDNYRRRTTTHLLSRLYYGITGVPLHKMSLCYKHKSINQTQQ